MFITILMIFAVTEKERTNNMATCRECLHFNICVKSINAPKDFALICDDFKNKSEYVKRERGEWIFDEDNDFYCSACKRYPPLMRQSDFCPNCGADMRKEDNSE